GTAKREAIELIRNAGAQPCAVLLALDRQERGDGPRSAVQELEAQYGIPCVSVITLAELIEALTSPADGRSRISVDQLTQLRRYREQYGAN
ncbi:MAG TPA: orotate phosphoribosyltransferase, partial [Steroidobacteraceae bacterium]